jgi:hypothetical protein
MKKIIFIFSILAVSCSGFSQQIEPDKRIDTLLDFVSRIDKNIQLNQSLEKGNQDLLAQRKKDSITINNKEKEVSDLKDLIKKKEGIEDDFNKYKQKQKQYLEEEISIIIKGTTNTDPNLLKKIQERALEVNPKNTRELDNFIKAYDTILSIKKVFQKEYEESSIRYEKSRWVRLSQFVNSQGSAFTGLKEEVNDLKRFLDEYCVNSEEIYRNFKKIYILKNDFSKGDAFTTELKKLTYYSKNYPYLFNLINLFLTDSNTQEKYKNGKVINCN